MLIVRTPVRISFGGGGTDLSSYWQRYGGNVLSATINKYVYSIVHESPDDYYQLVSSDLRICESWSHLAEIELNGNALAVPLAVLKSLAPTAPLDMFLASEIPPGTGLGSSAAVCVNTLHAITAYSGRGLSKRELAQQSFAIVREILGRATGKQDEFAVAFGGLNFYTFYMDGTTTVAPVPMAPESLRMLERKLMLFYTGRSRNSSTILQQQERSIDMADEAVLRPLHEIRRLAERMRDTLLKGDLAEFGALLHEGWESKKRTSNAISTAEIDRLYEMARANGVQGGKITGAGGGGFLLLYCDERHQPAVRQAFAAEKIKEMRFAFDAEGSRVLIHNAERSMRSRP
jgi:D-glycero-alpha-D-manno-heptose-7-phosphate kinase